MNFDEYLLSKKIDASAFEKGEPSLFQSWKSEFEQMHVNSFTVQKLNLINPIRRKYQLNEMPGGAENQITTPAVAPTPANPAQPRVARPVYKPKIS